MSLVTTYLIKKYKDNTPKTFHIIFSYLMYLGILIMGLFISNISTVISFVGAICSNSICYILPAAIYVSIAKRGTLFYKSIFLVLIFGISAGIISIVGICMKLA